MERTKLRLFCGLGFHTSAVVHKGVGEFQIFWLVECAIACARLTLFSVAHVCIVTQTSGSLLLVSKVLSMSKLVLREMYHVFLTY